MKESRPATYINQYETIMNYAEMLALVYEVAREMCGRGPGWSQQGAVLADLMHRIPNHRDVRVQQLILTCWHDLFRLGRLSWGFNIDNPDAPFFHVPGDHQGREVH